MKMHYKGESKRRVYCGTHIALPSATNDWSKVKCLRCLSKKPKKVRVRKRSDSTYSKGVKIFRTTLLRLLRRLAKNGCGDGGWCECLLCRVMLIVQTEQFRNAPIHKSSFPSPDQPASKHTRMVHWRGGLMEFAQGNHFDYCDKDYSKEDISREPWWGIKIDHGDGRKPYLWWIDYCGPPHLYLTEKAAKYYARQLRKQYECKVEVVPIGEIPRKKLKRKGDKV